MMLKFLFNQAGCRLPAGAQPRSRALLPLILLFTLVLSACTSAPQGVQPVSGFDAQRYLGRWYEVARLDHSFERGLSDVTAEYAWREDGGVAVLNRGFHEASGAWDEAQGKAYFIGEPTTGSLKVSFFGPFYGGYHIMALDESAPDYRYALVSGPNLNYLWVLSRTPTLPQATLDELLELAGEVGFPMDELILVDQTRHTGSSPP